MADTPYERVKGGRLTFKGGAIATNSKAISKKKKKNKNKNKQSSGGVDDVAVDGGGSGGGGVGGAGGGGEGVYTIDAAKKMKYEELFPVETKKFGYDPNAAKHKSVEHALDDRIKKKADRYCK